MSARLERLRERAGRYLAAGNLDATRAVCTSILAIASDDSAACLMLSDCAAAQDRQRDACAFALAGTSRAMEASAEQRLRLAMRLFSVGEYHAAATLIRKTNLRDTGSIHLFTNFSQQLRLLELHDESLAFLDAVINAGKGSASTFFLKGNALKFLGKLELSATEYERCLGLDPSHSGAHWSLASLGIATDAPQRIDRIRRLIDGGNLNAVDHCYLSFALFRELDNQDDTQGAWTALETGCRLKRSLVTHDRSGEATVFDRIRKAIDRVDPSAHEDIGKQKTPIFIVGMPRTGTTLMERIIGGHPQVTNCGELNDFRMQYKWASDHYSPGFLDLAGLERVGTLDWSSLGNRYLDHVAWRLSDRSHFTDKNPGNFIMAGLILRALPHARVIHMRRNPMDACFSNLKELFGGNTHAYSYDFADLASHHRCYRTLMDHWHQIAPGRILDIDYEDLVSEPGQTARRAMEHCGLAYDAQQVHTAYNTTPVSSASSVQVRQPIHARNVDGWKRYATPLAPLESLLRLEPDG